MPAATKLPVAPQGRRRALDTRHYRQSHAMCGPASLRIVLAYFGRPLRENVVAGACRSSDKTGTTGVNLVRAAHRLGFAASIVDGANLRTIQRWLDRDVPVIVDWMSAIARHPCRAMMPCGHYSVVCGLDRGHILLQDPAIGRRRRMTRRNFLDLWFDFIRVRPSRRDLVLRRLIVVRPRRANPPLRRARVANRDR
jgi:ABC-type bacteriocin/lantibiotic exporter with double-glycine peptidase domain